MTDPKRQYDRLMLRSAFQSLFWNVLLARKREGGLTRTGLADRLGIHKSIVTRAFSSPPNWQIDKIADIAGALDLELVVEAHDRTSGAIYTPSGIRNPATTASSIADVQDRTMRSVTSAGAASSGAGSSTAGFGNAA